MQLIKVKRQTLLLTENRKVNLNLSTRLSGKTRTTRTMKKQPQLQVKVTMEISKDGRMIVQLLQEKEINMVTVRMSHNIYIN